MSAPKCYPVLKTVAASDPAGLDNLLLAIGEGCARWAERKVAGLGVHINLWDGVDGLGEVVKDVISQQGIPNKRFNELVSPRIIAEQVGALKRKRRINR